jgi:chromosome segregation ATPase
MSEDRTGETRDTRSFEERMFARFDLVDDRFERIEGRLSNVDIRIGKLEERQYDTKPIWERALVAIEQVREAVDEIRTQLALTNSRLDTIDARFDKQETDADNNVRGLERKLDVLNKNILDLRADQRYVDSRLEKIEGQAKPS